MKTYLLSAFSISVSPLKCASFVFLIAFTCYSTQRQSGMSYIAHHSTLQATSRTIFTAFLSGFLLLLLLLLLIQDWIHDFNCVCIVLCDVWHFQNLHGLSFFSISNQLEACKIGFCFYFWWVLFWRKKRMAQQHSVTSGVWLQIFMGSGVKERTPHLA